MSGMFLNRFQLRLRWFIFRRILGFFRARNELQRI